MNGYVKVRDRGGFDEGQLEVRPYTWTTRGADFNKSTHKGFGVLWVEICYIKGRVSYRFYGEGVRLSG